ncbi:DUF4113 domain-containing protein [Vibrio splendidus]
MFRSRYRHFSQGTTQHWQINRNFLSPQYTTKLKDLSQIMC